MSSESFGAPQNTWLRNSLYGIYSEIPLEDGCETLSAQLCRDIYYASEGANIDLASISEVAVHQGQTQLRLEPIGETDQGVVCEWLNPEDPGDEPEIVFVCGTLFDLSIESDDLPLEFEGTELWPHTSEPKLFEASPNGRAGILLNRRIATFGHLAVRLTYSPEEFQKYRAINPVGFQPSAYSRFDKTIKGKRCIRAVPDDITFLRNTTGIEITDLKGSKKIFGQVI